MACQRLVLCNHAKKPSCKETDSEVGVNMNDELRKKVDKKRKYLEGLKVEGFMWEFIRHNQEYVALVKQMVEYAETYLPVGKNRLKDPRWVQMKKQLLELGKRWPGLFGQLKAGFKW